MRPTTPATDAQAALRGGRNQRRGGEHRTTAWVETARLKASGTRGVSGFQRHGTMPQRPMFSIKICPNFTGEWAQSITQHGQINEELDVARSDLEITPRFKLSSRNHAT